MKVVSHLLIGAILMAVSAAVVSPLIAAQQETAARQVTPAVPVVTNPPTTGARETIHDRPPRVRKPQEFGGLVEALPGGVVEGGAQHSMATFGFDQHQHRVPAAGDQRDVGRERREVGPGRVPGDPGRVQMRLVVVDADERTAQREGERLGGPCSDHEGLR